jgi:hypothetical protein
VLALGTASGLVAPAAHAADPSEIGAFSAPFREDGFSPSSGFDATTGCTAPVPGDATHPNGIVTCLPAGATAVQLTDGRVLYWNALENFENVQFGAVPEVGGVAVNDQARLLTIDPTDPANSTWATTTPLRGDPSTVNGRDESLFCSDQVILPDGRVLDAGGTSYYLEPALNEQFGVTELEGLRKSRIFDPASNTWTESGSMNYGRWYPGLVTMSDGRVFVASGVTKLIKPIYPDNPPQSGTNVEQTETYTPSTGLWTYNGTAGNRTLPLFPRMHLLPDGHVFYDAAGQAFNPMGQAYDEALWNIAASYDPQTQSWTDLGIPGVDFSDVPGSVQNALSAEPGFRGSTFNQQLLLKAPYNKASFITAGGVIGTTPGSLLPTDTTRIDTVTISDDGVETLSSKPAGKLNQRRWYSAGVTLPDGNVLALSGADLDEVAAPGFEHAIHQAELFDATTGTWKNVAVATRDRTYHNSAILLQDGRVLVGGHAPIPTGYGKTQTLPGFANNYHDASFELYSPPYLFRGPRPAITDSQNEAHYGQQFIVNTQQASDITSVRFVRNPAFTHLVDGDQRVVDLPIDSKAGSEVKVTIPSNPAVLPPGAYMVFIGTGSEADGTYVPSVAQQVLIAAGPAITPTPVAVTPVTPFPDENQITNTVSWLLGIVLGILGLEPPAPPSAQ